MACAHAFRGVAHACMPLAEALCFPKMALTTQQHGVGDSLPWDCTACVPPKILAWELPAALQPRDLPLEDQSVFEHLLALRDAGWTWRPAPTTPAAKRVLAPVSLPQNDEEAIGPLVFYSGLTISKEYMMCLLQADQLRLLGIAQIPHCIPLRGYTALLDGQPYVAPALQDRKRRILCDGASTNK